MDHTIVEAADCHDITLLCLPSQTTHELQPMDKSVFEPLEHYWDKQVRLLYSHCKDHTLTKKRFGNIFTEAWDKQPNQPTLKQDFMPLASIPPIPQLFLTKTLVPVL